MSFLFLLQTYKTKITQNHTNIGHQIQADHIIIYKLQISSQNLSEIGIHISETKLNGNFSQDIDDICFQEDSTGNHFHPFPRNHALVWRRS